MGSQAMKLLVLLSGERVPGSRPCGREWTPQAGQRYPRVSKRGPRQGNETVFSVLGASPCLWSVQVCMLAPVTCAVSLVTPTLGGFSHTVSWPGLWGGLGWAVFIWAGT